MTSTLDHEFITVKGDVIRSFEDKSGIVDVRSEVKATLEGPAIILELAAPSERFYAIVNQIDAGINHDIVSTVLLTEKKPRSPLASAEARYFSRVLSESLNINRSSFGEAFFSRYTNSVSNAEDSVVTSANHIVFGRRGAGKSSLLLYALRKREVKGAASAWLDMQAYEKRTDTKLHIDVLMEIVKQLIRHKRNDVRLPALEFELIQLRRRDDVTMDNVRQLIPDVRSGFEAVGDVFIFLDDFHVVELEEQASLLGTLYAASRGTNVKLKVSAIRTLTKPWDAKTHTGLQVGQDAQSISLDYNLTMPDKASAHIQGILDSHARFCGLPSVLFLCGDVEVLNRLIWVSAGVPRDALNLFNQAMTKANVAGRARVSVTDINLAASDTVSDKTSEVESDTVGSDEESQLLQILDVIKEFCINKHRTNAFLVEIKTGRKLYRQILQLVDLRVIHVISEGITVGKAGEKYLALMLDYAFYTGTRAAQSVVLFNKKTQKVNRSELRKLPVLSEQASK